MQERHSAAVTREQLAAWHADADRVEAVRDQLANELSTRYRAITAELVDLFTRIAACDREVGRINGSAPGFDRRRLLGVELTARGIDRFGLNDRPIADMTRCVFRLLRAVTVRLWLGRFRPFRFPYKLR
jgi:hypothetical protein